MDQLIAGDPSSIGPYRLIARLGAGGMGLVYLGRSDLGRTVAVKVVQAEHAQHPEFRSRFTREVAAAQRVGGHWTAAVLDADTGAPTPWVATQYIPGPDLQTVVGKDFGPLPEHSVRILANRLALALQAVHEAGLIHRDLKPSNVLVTVDGPRVIDFGIARAMDTLLGTNLQTSTGSLVGSPGFMSPEQVRGLELTGASDVFCLGAVLVFAATGRRLFGAGTTGLHAHLFRVAEEEPDLTGVPESLVGLVAECLDKDPAKRPTPQQIAARAVADSEEEWLPSPVLAQLGRHAAELLDFAPEVRAPAPAVQAFYQHLPQPSPPPQPWPVGQPSVGQPPVGQPPVPAGYGVPPQDRAPGAFPHQGHPGAWAPVAAPAYAEDGAPPHPRRWWGLAVAVVAQLLVLGNLTAFNVALPEIVSDLGIRPEDTVPMFLWYLVAAGGLLLLGGHLVDLIGRKPALVAGLVGFALASTAAGLAPSSLVLLGGRTLQGVFAALLTPAALSVVTSAFPEARERRRALGVYTATATSGTILGILAGGWLMDALSWRMSLLVDVPVAVVAALGAVTLLPNRSGPAGVRPDPLGVLLGCVGLGALLGGLDELSSHSWTDGTVLAPCLVGVVLLTALAAWLATTREALLPRQVWSPGRIGALLTLLLAAAGAYALMLTLSYALQQVFGYTPGRVGVTLLPMVAAIVLAATQISARLLGRIPAQLLVVAGLAVTALGLALLTGMSVGGGYVAQILPGTVLAGLGTGLAWTPLFAAATADLGVRRSGATAASAAMAQQLGSLVGLALLTKVVDDRLHANVSHLASATGPSLTEAMLRAYTYGLWWAVGVTLLAALVAGLTLRSPRRSETDHDPLPAV